MLSARPASSRVVVGLETDSNVATAIRTAVLLATVRDADLRCVVVQQEELLDAAQLPFASAVARGGRIVPFTSSLIEAHFKSVCREAERDLAAACVNRQVSWQLQRLHGIFLRELISSLRPGDTVVLGRSRERAMPHAALRRIRDILLIADAVVLPARQPRTSGWVRAFGGSKANLLAEEFARGFGLPRDEASWDSVLRPRRPAAVVVTSLDVMESARDSNLLGTLDAMGTTIVIVAEAITESERLPR
jgi:hypothetical protein